MIISWDNAKRLANIEKHGLDFADLTLDFFERAFVILARAPRYKAIGTMGVGVVVVIFAPLGAEAISIISARSASRKERTLFDERQTRQQGG